MSRDLALGGLTPFTTIDFPGRLAAVLFCQGCPWRCGYCHNPHLLPFGGAAMTWRAAKSFLDSRRGLIEAVVFSGGEPLAQPALPAAMSEAGALGFAVGLHTAGSSPRRLRAALEHADWVGFDVKAPFARYAEVVGTAAGRAARASLAALVASGRPFEVRTTVDAAVLDGPALIVMAEELTALGVHRWRLQRRRGSCAGVDPLADAGLLARLSATMADVSVSG